LKSCTAVTRLFITRLFITRRRWVFRLFGRFVRRRRRRFIVRRLIIRHVIRIRRLARRS
jgi:hypothetical protein